MGAPEPAQAPPPGAEQPHEAGGQSLLSTLADTALETGREVPREQAAGPLVSVLLETLFSAPVRLAIEQHADEALHALLQASVEALAEDAWGEGLEAQLARTEHTARQLLAATLDEAFSPAARAELQQELEQAMQAALDTDPDAARDHAELAVQAVLRHALTAVQRPWEHQTSPEDWLRRLALSMANRGRGGPPGRRPGSGDLPTDPGLARAVGLCRRRWARQSNG
jgi:hypothetical protein